MSKNDNNAPSNILNLVKKDLATAVEIFTIELKLIEDILLNSNAYLKPEHGQEFEVKVRNVLTRIETDLEKLSLPGEVSHIVKGCHKSMCELVVVIGNLSYLPPDVQEDNRDLFLSQYIREGNLRFRKVNAALKSLDGIY